jgi:3-hydroxybutyryl-CoA dehydrogenase
MSEKRRPCIRSNKVSEYDDNGAKPFIRDDNFLDLLKLIQQKEEKRLL